MAPRELAAISGLLTGRSVQLASGPAPLAGRDLADPGREDLTLATAVARMRGAFTAVTEVVSAAEHVWTEVAGRLDAVGAELARVTPLAATLGDEALAGHLAAAQGQLARLRDTLNSDPLALWLVPPARARSTPRGGPAAGARRGRRGPGRRADPAAERGPPARRRGAAAAAAARSAREDAAAAWQQAAAKIAAGALPPEPADLADLSARLAGLGRCWPRPVAAPGVRAGPARPRAGHRDGWLQGGRTGLVAAMAKRDELRGLLGAYKAKAARLGAVEDAALAERYDRARDLLWTAPCDLTAAEAAVAGYQQAVLGVQPR